MAFTSLGFDAFIIAFLQDFSYLSQDGFKHDWSISSVTFAGFGLGYYCGSVLPGLVGVVPVGVVDVVGSFGTGEVEPELVVVVPVVVFLVFGSV